MPAAPGRRGNYWLARLRRKLTLCAKALSCAAHHGGGGIKTNQKDEYFK